MSVAELRKAAPIVSLSMGLRPFRDGCGVVHCKVRLDSRGSALWDMRGERRPVPTMGQAHFVRVG